MTVFAQARDAEASAEEFPVDDGRKLVEVELEAVLTHTNGVNGNGAATMVSRTEGQQL